MSKSPLNTSDLCRSAYTVSLIPPVALAPALLKEKQVKPNRREATPAVRDMGVVSDND